jgi:autotransporter family porin
MLSLRTKLLCGSFFVAGLSFLSVPVMAEDCTDELPAATCTIDEDTTAPLTIADGEQLIINGSITIDHTIDGDTADEDGIGEVISSDGLTNTITQNADIGSINPILSLAIGEGDTWNAYGAIITGGTADSIDLGQADGGAAETLNFNVGSSYVGEINGEAADMVNFGQDGEGGFFVTGGQVETVAVTLTSGQLTVEDAFGSGVGLSALNINDGTLLIAGENIIVGAGSTLTLDGSLWIKPEISVSTDLYASGGDGGTLRIGVFQADNGDPVSGKLTVGAGGPVDFSQDNIEIYIEDESQVLEAGLIEDVIVGNGGEPIGPAQLIDNSYLYDFELVSNGADNLDLNVSRNALDDIASTPNNKRVAEIILNDRAIVTNNPINAIQTSLGRASTREEFNDRLEALQPAVDGGYVMASVAAVDQALTITQTRLDSLRTGSRTGMSSGEISKGLKVWGQGFGTAGEQDTRDGISGYEVDTYGAAVGVDTGGKESNWVMGVSGSYAVSDVTSKDANQTETEIQTFQLSVYGDYKLEDKSFFSGMLGYALNDNDNERKAIGGVTGLNAQAAFQTEQITLRGEYGKPLNVGRNVVLTPKLKSNYAFIEVEDYTETGANNANLFVDTDEMHIVEVGTGMELAWEKTYHDGSFFRPAVEVGYMYDVNNAEMLSVASFVDGGDSFEVEGFTRQQHTVDLDTGFTYGTDIWEVMANYNYTYKGDFTSHAGSVRAAYKF